MEKFSPAVRGTTFPSLAWEQLSDVLADSFRFTPEERGQLKASRTARLIAALPFLAGCSQPARISLAHVSVYLLARNESARAIFDHEPADNAAVLRRLESIMNFSDGDTRTIRRGMLLLALQMVCGYARDQAKDLVSGEYNPLLAGAWDARTMIDSLVKQLEELPSPELDGVMTVEDAQCLWWSW